MENSELQEVLRKHALYLADDPDGEKANLYEKDLQYANFRGANLRLADMRFANLKRADFRHADLSRADISMVDMRFADLSNANLRCAFFGGSNLQNALLCDADLFGAALTWADFSRADLTGANLAKTDLENTKFDNANLSKTCLDPQIAVNIKTFMQECPARAGKRVVYRTALSRYIGSKEYTPGDHVAPILSFSAETECHPGIYAGSLRCITEMFSYLDVFAKCIVEDGNWVITSKGAIRCSKLTVIGYVNRKGRKVKCPF